MKKDKLILIFSLIVIFGSGGIIYLFQDTNSIPLAQPELSADMSQQSVMLLNQISSDKKRLESETDNFVLLVSLGNNYYDLNNPEESIKYYEMALKLKPDVPEIMVDCGAMYRQLGDFEKALALFKKALKIAPGLPQASFNLGAVLFAEKNDPKAAEEIWQNFLSSNPGVSADIKGFFNEKIEQAQAAIDHDH